MIMFSFNAETLWRITKRFFSFAWKWILASAVASIAILVVNQLAYAWMVVSIAWFTIAVAYPSYQDICNDQAPCKYEKMRMRAEKKMEEQAQKRATFRNTPADVLALRRELAKDVDTCLGDAEMKWAWRSPSAVKTITAWKSKNVMESFTGELVLDEDYRVMTVILKRGGQEYGYPNLPLEYQKRATELRQQADHSCDVNATREESQCPVVPSQPATKTPAEVNQLDWISDEDLQRHVGLVADSVATEVNNLATVAERAGEDRVIIEWPEGIRTEKAAKMLADHILGRTPFVGIRVFTDPQEIHFEMPHRVAEEADADSECLVSETHEGCAEAAPEECAPEKHIVSSAEPGKDNLQLPYEEDDGDDSEEILYDH